MKKPVVMHCLVQDESCHWYLIPAARSDEFYTIAADPYTDDFPDWAIRLRGGPQEVQFPSYMRT